MNHLSSLTERLTRAFTRPTRGVLGLVDELLAASLERGLHLAWRAGLCHVRYIEDGSAGRIEIPVLQSVVRAVLARIAALCNERIPDSVSPYGGTGELSVESDPAEVIRATFVNTPDQQSLEITPSRSGITRQNGEMSLEVETAENRPR